MKLKELHSVMQAGLRMEWSFKNLNASSLHRFDGPSTAFYDGEAVQNFLLPAMHPACADVPAAGTCLAAAPG